MKVAIVGLGHVGSTLAYTMVLRGLCREVALISRRNDFAKAEAADLNHAAALTEHPITVCGGGMELATKVDIFVITDSIKWEPGTGSRNDLAVGNVKKFQEVLPSLAKKNPNAIFIIVSNPVDVMSWHALQITQLPATRVFGVGTLIDSMRFRKLLSSKVGIHSDDLRAYILGEHGEHQFAAMSVATAGGEPINNREALVKQAAQSAFEIVQHRGYTNYAVSVAVTLLLDSIIHDLKRTIPVSQLIDGYLGVQDVCLSVPAVIGKNGIERVLSPALNESEIASFKKAAEAIQKVIAESSNQ